MSYTKQSYACASGGDIHNQRNSKIYHCECEDDGVDSSINPLVCATTNKTKQAKEKRDASSNVQLFLVTWLNVIKKPTTVCVTLVIVQVDTVNVDMDRLNSTINRRQNNGCFTAGQCFIATVGNKSNEINSVNPPLCLLLNHFGTQGRFSLWVIGSFRLA